MTKYTKDIKKISKKINTIAQMGEDGKFRYYEYVDELVRNSLYDVFQYVLLKNYGIHAETYASVKELKEKTFHIIRKGTVSKQQTTFKSTFDSNNVYQIGLHFYDSRNNIYLGDIIEDEENKYNIAYRDPELTSLLYENEIINLNVVVGLSSSIYSAIPTFEVNPNLSIKYYPNTCVVYNDTIWICSATYSWDKNNMITPTWSAYWDVFNGPTYSTLYISDNKISLLDKYKQAITWIKGKTNI